MDKKSKKEDKKKDKKHKRLKKDLDHNQGEKVPETKFRWIKKELKDKALGLSKEEIKERERKRKEEAKIELEKIQRKRQEREIELKLREKEKTRLMLENELNTLGDWESKENEAKKRAAIRIKNSRANPIDLLAMNLKFIGINDNYKSDDEEEDYKGIKINFESPYLLMDRLTNLELKKLYEDIRNFIKMERRAKNFSKTSLEYWNSLLKCCEEKLGQNRDLNQHLENPIATTWHRIPIEVLEEINELLKNKSERELAKLKKDIEYKVQSKSLVDEEYWDWNSQMIDVQICKLKIDHFHNMVIERAFNKLKKVQDSSRQFALNEFMNINQKSDHSLDVKCTSPELLPLFNGLDDIVFTDQVKLDENYSIPSNFSCAENKIEIENWYKDNNLDPLVYKWINDTDDIQNRIKLQKEIISKKYVPKMYQMDEFKDEEIENDKEEFEVEGLKHVLHNDERYEDEELFDQEPIIEKGSDSSLRIPKYYNRVHTGFEWNKYNSTHYDEDNQPPRIITGYKFNIFYNDLPAEKVPKFRLEEDKNSENMIFIKFIAGPPYLDIAFKIVDKEWETSHKKKFRSCFENGLLQLYFHFRRRTYKR